MTFPIDESQPRMQLNAVVDIADLTDGVALDVFDLPVGATDIVVSSNVLTAFASATTDAGVIDLETDTHVFATGADILGSTGAVAITARAGAKLAAADKVRLKWTSSGTASVVGSVELNCSFIVAGRAGYVAG